jgi:hypothetical protein
MLTLATVISALLFVLSSGLLFNERFRNNKWLMTVAGLLALVASYFLLEQIVDAVVSRRLQKEDPGTDLRQVLLPGTLTKFLSSDFARNILATTAAALAVAAAVYVWHRIGRTLPESPSTPWPAAKGEPWKEPRRNTIAMPAGVTHWYLARDGQQFGPISEAELAKFIELGHLQPTDLLWREGFPDWRPALVVFPPRSSAQPQPTDGSARWQTSNANPSSLDRRDNEGGHIGPGLLVGLLAVIAFGGYVGGEIGARIVGWFGFSDQWNMAQVFFVTWGAGLGLASWIVVFKSMAHFKKP